MANTTQNEDFLSVVGIDKEALNQALIRVFEEYREEEVKSQSNLFEHLRDTLSYNELLALATMQVSKIFEDKEK